MLSFLFLIAAAPAYDNLGIQVLAGLIVVVVATAVGSVINRGRKAHEEKVEEEKTVVEKLDSLKTLAESMHVALVGADKTPLNPTPPPGLIDISRDLNKRTQRIEHTLFVNGGAGNTILDRLDRMEKTTRKGVAGVARIEDRQTELRDAAEVEDGEDTNGH